MNRLFAFIIATLLPWLPVQSQQQCAFTVCEPSQQRSSIPDEQELREAFLNPPPESRPRVWWHWMDGNITCDGIRKDLLWMHRAGIGGVHCFEAGTGIEPVVPQRLVYMSPEWQQAFRYALSLADSLGMEVAIASCPGWSNTGGPWVTKEQAMKRLTWSQLPVRGGRLLSVTLPQPATTADWYRDTHVIAVRRQRGEQTIDSTSATLLRSPVGETPVWLQYELKQPLTVKALCLADGNYRSLWAAMPAPVTRHLEASDDGVTFRRICDIPHGSVTRQTISVTPTKARYFRVVYDTPPPATSQLELYTTPRINHAEEKAGRATPSDLLQHLTTATPAEVPALADVVDLTGMMDADGRLTWQAPRGEWTVYRFGYTLTGKQNHPAPREATGYEVTKIDKDAFTAFLEHYLDMYRSVADSLMGSRGLHYLLIDSYEAGFETWAPQLEEEFLSRRGYSLRPWLPVLTGQVIGSGQASEAFLADWRQTIGELIVECMYDNAAATAHRYGLETYFEAHENGRLYLADGMAVKSRADVPMAAIWVVPEGRGANHSSVKMAECDIRESASVAHLYGKRLVAAESMTIDGSLGGAYSCYPGNLKPTADVAMACGVNRFVIHESAHQPTDTCQPGLGLMQYGQWFNRHETWAEQARAWTDYLARSCYLLQQGQNVADILYYYGEDDVVTSRFAHEHPAIPFGYNFDYLNSEALLSLITFAGTHFVTPAGSRYRLLVVDPRCQHHSAPVIRKLEALRQQGAPVVSAASFTSSTSSSPLPPHLPPQDISADDPTDLRFVHRTTPAAEIYWLSNQRDAPRRLAVTFRVTGLKPSLWHPETGLSEPLSYTIGDSTTTVTLPLTAHDAVFVVFSGRPDTPSVSLPETHTTLLRTIDTPWAVTFKPKFYADAPSSFLLPPSSFLPSLTESADPAIKYFAGTAIYNNKVSLSEAELREGHLILDLGRVGCIAEVSVGGQPVATLWRAPYTVDITDAVVLGENTLEIRVTNLWVNRIIGQLNMPHSSPLTTSRQFYRADSPLLPSGLMGPVRIFLRR